MSLQEGASGANGSDDAATRILNETIDVIDRSGEASVRLTQVARRAGVTQGLISYHFGDRDSLVAAAQLRRFLDCDSEILEELRVRRSTPPSPQETRKLLIAVLRRPFDDPGGLRRRRVSALGASLYRPLVGNGVVEHHCNMIEALSELLEEGQQLGVVRTTLDPRAAASLIAMTWYGAIAFELDRNDDREVGDPAISLLESLILEP